MKIEVEEAVRIVEGEPEFPGSMPVDLYFLQLLYALFAPTKVARAACRATKRGIVARLREKEMGPW